MFEKLKEKHRLEQERRIEELKKEEDRINNLSEKELLIEILYELKKINSKCDDIDRDIMIYNSN